MRQGEPGDKLYLIEKGAAEVLSVEGGRERRVGALAQGDYFGEMALLTNAPRSSTVRAAAETRVYSLSRPDFLALLEREPAIRQAVADTVEARRATLVGVISTTKEQAAVSVA